MFITKETVENMIAKAKAVVDNWERGNLARAVREMDEAAVFLIDEAHPRKRKHAFKPNKKTPEGRNNSERAETAEYAVASGERARGDGGNGTDEDGIRDLLADLGHLCDREGLDYLAILETAVADWRSER